MLGLTLRKEFQSRRLKGTAIELTSPNQTGATQIAAAEFLRITYPTGDLLKALEVIGPGRGQSLVLIGGRGQGKSHLMGALYHALTNESATRSWLQKWSGRLSNPKIAGIPSRNGSLTGAQLKRLLKALPGGMTYGLSLEMEDD